MLIGGVFYIKKIKNEDRLGVLGIVTRKLKAGRVNGNQTNKKWASGKFQITHE